MRFGRRVAPAVDAQEIGEGGAFCTRKSVQRGPAPLPDVDGALRAGSVATLLGVIARANHCVLPAPGRRRRALSTGAAASTRRASRRSSAARVAIDVLGHRAIEREAALRLVLVQGVSSGERMDFTIRKAVELGVAEVHPGAGRGFDGAAEGRAMPRRATSTGSG